MGRSSWAKFFQPSSAHSSASLWRGFFGRRLALGAGFGGGGGGASSSSLDESPPVGGSGPAHVVEIVHFQWVAGESFGRGDVFDADPGPEPVGVAEGAEAAFGRDAGAGEDHDLSV